VTPSLARPFVKYVVELVNRPKRKHAMHSLTLLMGGLRHRFCHPRHHMGMNGPPEVPVVAVLK
jgi:hypothetical protein